MQTQRHQTTASKGLSVLRLAGLIPSPYTKELNGIGSVRDTNISEIMKAIYGLDYVAINGGSQYVGVGFFDMTTSPGTCVDVQNLQLDMADVSTPLALSTAAIGAINTYATGQAYNLSDGIISVFATNDAVARSFANPTRSLNSSFQVSTTRDSIVSYTVDIAATLSLTTGQAGTVALKYADDSGMTTNVVTVQSSVNGNAGTLAIGLGLTQTATAALGGVIPSGKYVKLVTTNTTGTPTFTMRAAQEVLI